MLTRYKAACFVLTPMEIYVFSQFSIDILTRGFTILFWKSPLLRMFFFYLPLDSHTICILVDMQEEFIFGCLVLMLLILHNQGRQFGFQQVKIVERFEWSHQCFDQNIKLQSTISKFFDRCFEHLLKTNFSDTRWWCVVIDSYAQTTSSYMKIKIARDEYDVFTSF